MAMEGLGPAAIKRRAIVIKRHTVSQLSEVQILYDLQKCRREALAASADTSAALLKRTLEELARVAFGDLRTVMTWGEDGVEFHESGDLDEDSAAIVSSVTYKSRWEPGEDGAMIVDKKIETHNKNAALQALLKHLAPLEVKFTLDVRKDVSELSEEELLAALRGKTEGGV